MQGRILGKEQGEGVAMGSEIGQTPVGILAISLTSHETLWIRRWEL